MTWAALFFSILTVVVAITGAVLVTVRVSEALEDAFRALDRQNQRHAQQMSDLLDRLMTIKWEDYAAVKAAEGLEEGGFFSPSEQDEEETQIIPPTGPYGLHDEPRRGDNVSRLIEEDFPVENR